MLPKVSRNTKLLSLASFLTDVSSEMITPLLPFFLTQVLLAPALLAGLMEGIREFTANATGILSGLYSDGIGRRKRMIVAGYGISTLAKALLTMIINGPQLIAVVFIERMGKGIRDPPRDALIVESEPSENLGRAFGVRKMMDNAGAVLGPMIAGVLLIVLGTPSLETYRTIFWIALIPAVITVALLFWVQERRTDGQKPKKVLWEVLHTRNYKRFLAGMGIFSLGAFSVPLFLLYTGQFIPLLLVPLAYLGYNVFYTIFAVPAGYVTDRLGGKRALMVALVLFLLVLTGFSLGANAASVFVLMALLGVFMAFEDTAPRVFIAKSVEHRDYASAIGIYRGVLGMIALPANLVAGLLWDKAWMGVPAPFLFAMVTTLFGIVMMGWLVKE